MDSKAMEARIKQLEEQVASFKELAAIFPPSPLLFW